MSAFFARHALLPNGWAENVRFEIDASGNFSAVTPDSSPRGATPLLGLTLPGMPNAHSHAFQRVLAGHTEFAGSSADSFWTWREAMYAQLETIDPDRFEAIATDAYATMLEAGYTTVCEFHYVHHAPGGTPYAVRTELADRLVAAARSTGIALTLLDVLYRYSDFGNSPPSPQQARFVQSREAFVDEWLALRAAYGDDAQITLGLAPHSLRAVGMDDVRALVELAANYGEAAPLHVHASEQLREVDACRAVHGTTPIDLLARHVELNRRWCFVHATHATSHERAAIARANAVAALCPTTEANLGDGIFPAAEFTRNGGRIAIGSDSNVSIDVADELRSLEYAQRLTLRERNVLCDESTPSVARYLYTSAARGGAQAAGRKTGRLEKDFRADMIAMEPIEAVDAEATLAIHVFRSGSWRVRDAICGGRHVVRQGRHAARAAPADRT
ncbi:MAG: formimidoylglutamate deiminase [Candidatus Eremiobacteraeota bacterium]|nr:formimidoylglutamate deiminase [Candidatus Eremiobacteraeota bacterium]